MLAHRKPSETTLAFEPLPNGHDYDAVRKAIRFLSEYKNDQPSLAKLAEHVGMDPTACHKLFKRWCGLTPKEFLQAITLDHVRSLLAQSATVLETAHDSGLSGGGRLHDLCVSFDAVTPGEIKKRGAGVSFRYGFHETPFGKAVALTTERGLAGLAFANDDAGAPIEAALDEFRHRWPAAEFLHDGAASEGLVSSAFAPLRQKSPQPIRLVLIGTDFEIQVWQALLEIPVAGAVSYQTIADHIGKPSATRAVGTAIGHNPISFVVPCHRVMRQDGGLGGYHWGLTRKRAMIGWEFGQQVRD